LSVIFRYFEDRNVSLDNHYQTLYDKIQLKLDNDQKLISMLKEQQGDVLRNLQCLLDKIDNAQHATAELAISFSDAFEDVNKSISGISGLVSSIYDDDRKKESLFSDFSHSCDGYIDSLKTISGSLENVEEEINKSVSAIAQKYSDSISSTMKVMNLDIIKMLKEKVDVIQQAVSIDIANSVYNIKDSISESICKIPQKVDNIGERVDENFEDMKEGLNNMSKTIQSVNESLTQKLSNYCDCMSEVNKEETLLIKQIKDL
jgi:archaellum component FlaC